MSPRPPPSWAQVDGFTYERSAIAKWFETRFEDHDTDPETGAKLESKMLIPNRRLKSLIRGFQEARRRRQRKKRKSRRALRPQLRPCHCLSSHER